MKTLTFLALAPVRLAAAILTAAVTDRLDALTEQIEGVKLDLEDAGDVTTELIERIEDLEAVNTPNARIEDERFCAAIDRITDRAARDREQVVA
jgi:hypothetical protein